MQMQKNKSIMGVSWDAVSRKVFMLGNLSHLMQEVSSGAVCKGLPNYADIPETQKPDVCRVRLPLPPATKVRAAKSADTAEVMSSLTWE